VADINEVIKFISNSQRTLWILCGLPYSGKTYLAKKILENVECKFVSIDEILADNGYDWESNKLPDKRGWEKIFEFSYKETEEALKNDSNVLYDSTNHTRASRDTLRNIARGVGADARIIYVDTPVTIVRERWERSKDSGDRFVLGEKLLNETIDALEKPTEDENVLIIS